MDYKTIQSVVDPYLLLADPLILKLLPGIIMANRITSLTPTWFFLVGASSGGKSTLLEALESVNGTFYMDDLSANTLFSGMKSAEKNNSLIRAIPQFGTVIMTDFTLMLDKDEIATKQIMSQFRLIYDGKFRSFKGNGTEHKETPHFGLILGVTSAVFEKQQQYAALGERLSYFIFEQPIDRVKVGVKALDNIEKGAEIKKVIGDAYTEWYSEAVIPETLGTFDDSLKLNLVRLCEMATKARSSISRKKYSRDNPITNVHFLEMPGRLAKQMLNLAYGLRTLNKSGELEQEDYQILYKSALDSIPIERRKVMEKLTTFQSTDVSSVAAALGLPYETVKIHVEDLASLGVLIQHKSHSAGKFTFELQPEYRELISEFKNISMTSKPLELEETVAEEPVPLSAYEADSLTQAGLI